MAEVEVPKRKERSIEWTDKNGKTYFYYRNPLLSATSFILVLEMCERMAFYGMVPNLVDFLTTHAKMSDNSAYKYVQFFKSIAYFTPLLSGILSDLYLGTYITILIFSLVYTVGYILLDISSLSNPGENVWLIHMSILGFISIGTGGIKAAVNVLGAQQFHPEKQVDGLNTFFTYFYASINIGGFIGGIVCPTLYNEVSPFACFMVPAVAFLIGLIVFILGTPRYVRFKAKSSVFFEVLKIMCSALFSGSWEKCKQSNGGKYFDGNVDDAKRFVCLIPLFFLVLPFNFAYDQMTTTFLVQGQKMTPVYIGGWHITPALMNNSDPIFVLLSSVLLDVCIYGPLKARNKMISVPIRFCIGCLLATVAMLASFGIETAISTSDELYAISLLWQLLPYFLIANGELFVLSTSYEFAFAQSPEPLKVVGSATVLLVMSISSLTSTPIYAACKAWMPDFDPDDRCSWSAECGVSHYNYWYLVFAGVSFAGAISAFLLKGYYKKHCNSAS